MSRLGRTGTLRCPHGRLRVSCRPHAHALFAGGRLDRLRAMILFSAFAYPGQRFGLVTGRRTFCPSDNKHRQQNSGRFSFGPARFHFGDRGKSSATINTLSQPPCQRIDFAFRLLTILIASAIPAVQSNKVYPPMRPFAADSSSRCRRIRIELLIFKLDERKTTIL